MAGDWGESKIPYVTDLELTNGRLEAELRMVPQASDRADCEVTGYDSEGIHVADLSPGTVLCVRSRTPTDEEHLGRVTIRKAGEEQVSFDVLVWR
ncbi:hypothetical protein [Streptomyces albogriseolus]|uniref:hypothetical protein n=1 Tax=Streptomyces albogriseolus TaxID=1887 RepID=UPI003460D509